MCARGKFQREYNGLILGNLETLHYNHVNIMSFDYTQQLREFFPILRQEISGKPLVYFDNAATTQKPEVVIDSISRYYREVNSNIHRAPHTLAEKATALYENTRKSVRRFINATSIEEIIFTSGTTHSVNLIAYTLGDSIITKEDEILLTELEHHSNIVPWQMLASRREGKVLAAKATDAGEIDLSHFEELLSERTKIVSFAYASNALGTIHPVKRMIEMVRKKSPNALVVIDGAQAVGHGPIDVTEVGCDFFCFSGHKMYGPTGVGVLYGKKSLLENMPPFLGGGDMIENVSFSGTTFAQLPSRFEAGTPNISAVVGLGAAVDFLSALSWGDLQRTENELHLRMREGLRKIPKVKIIGESASSIGIVSFIVEGETPIDIAIRLNHFGIAVRAGHHCCMPLMERLKINGTVRASLGIYNSQEEVDRLLTALMSIVDRASPRNISRGLSLQYGIPQDVSIQAALDALKDVFSSCESSEEKQELLMEFGLDHPVQLEKLREVAPALKGCLSEVRIHTKVDEDRKFFISTDSNSQLIRGLLSVIERCISGRNVEEIKKVGAFNIFESLKFSDFISVSRRSGMLSLMSEIEKALSEA